MTIQEIKNKLLEVLYEELENANIGEKIPSEKSLAKKVGCASASINKAQNILSDLGCFELERISSSKTILRNLDLAKFVDAYDTPELRICLPYGTSARHDAIASAINEEISDRNTTYQYSTIDRLEKLIEGKVDVIVISKLDYLRFNNNGMLSCLVEFEEKSYADYKIIKLKENEYKCENVGIDYNSTDHTTEIFSVFNCENIKLIPIRETKIKEALKKKIIDVSVIDSNEFYEEDFEIVPLDFNVDSSIAVIVCLKNKAPFIRSKFDQNTLNCKRYRIMSGEEIPIL